MIKQPCAFFDVDGTIINTRSILSFLDYIRLKLKLDYCENFITYYLKLCDMLAAGAPREEANRFCYSIYKGYRRDQLHKWGKEWFEINESEAGFYNPFVMKLIKKHQQSGHRIVLVTGSFRPLIEPLLSKIGGSDIICTELQHYNGIFTGELEGGACIGNGKKEKMIAYSEQDNLDLKSCYGYGDDISDLPMLNLCGYSMLVTPTKAYISSINLK